MSLIGLPRERLDTPALWVELDRMEGNIDCLADYFRQAGIAWRPHTKGIKVPAIAHKLLKAGAIGVTCAKLSEAEVMAASGIEDILVANQVVGDTKVARLIQLRRSADVMVAIDSLENATKIARAARNAGVRIRVLIELDSGMHRAGVPVGETAIPFAKKIAGLPGLAFAGLMAWEGHAFRALDRQEREAVIAEAVHQLVHTAELLRAAGIDVGIVSCGGSVSYQTASHIAGVTESQTGGAVFTDAAYLARGVPLSPSLYVTATVTSRPTPTQVIVDAGRKSMDGSVAMPVPIGIDGATLSGLSAEHGMVQLDRPSETPRVADRIDFMVGYGDNTVYQHDLLYGVRGETIEAVWAILGRGKLT
ncbi:alanine racemase [Candidatus Bipolaricaulota bacterium]|nr:alanine racemase [Candidatus Bipolaricaulota bacterium]